ncbi:hypothetical protein DFH06DRAFT_1206430, partial [Mycena polygramma]
MNLSHGRSPPQVEIYQPTRPAATMDLSTHLKLHAWIGLNAQGDRGYVGADQVDGLSRNLAKANEPNCHYEVQGQTSDVIVRHFERCDDLQSLDPLDLMETLKLAYRLKHYRLIDLVECVCIQRLQECAMRSVPELSKQTAATPVESTEWKARLEMRSVAMDSCLAKLVDQTIKAREMIAFVRAMRA